MVHRGTPVSWYTEAPVQTPESLSAYAVVTHGEFQGHILFSLVGEFFTTHRETSEGG